MPDIKTSLLRILQLPAGPAATRVISSVLLREKRSGDLGGLGNPHRQHIVVIRLDGIGDLIMTSALLRELRRAFPEAVISLVVKPNTSPIVELCPYIDRLLTFDSSGSALVRSIVRQWRAVKLSRQIRDPQPPDVAIIPRWDADTDHAVPLGFLLGARSRISYSERVNQRKRSANRGFDKLLTVAVMDIEPKHEVDRNLDLLRTVGAIASTRHLEAWTSQDDKQFAEDRLLSQARDNKSATVALAVGAGSPKRIWPAEGFAEVAHRLSRNGYKVVILGGGDDRPYARVVRSAAPGALDMTGKTTLRQTIAVIERCKLLISNDSAPIHMAAATNTPVVEISSHVENGQWFGPNSPFRFGPWNVDHAIVQPLRASYPCSGWCTVEDAPHCILEVSPAVVLEAAERQLTVVDKDKIGTAD